MTIYLCDKCSKEDGEDYPPCVYIDTFAGALSPEWCPLMHTWGDGAIVAKWEIVDKIPEDVKL